MGGGGGGREEEEGRGKGRRVKVLMARDLKPLSPDLEGGVE